MGMVTLRGIIRSTETSSVGAKCFDGFELVQNHGSAEASSAGAALSWRWNSGDTC